MVCSVRKSVLLSARNRVDTAVCISLPNNLKHNDYFSENNLSVFSIECPRLLVCFSTAMHSYQDLLARYVLGHAMRMFPLCIRYDLSSMFLSVKLLTQ